LDYLFSHVTGAKRMTPDKNSDARGEAHLSLGRFYQRIEIVHDIQRTLFYFPLLLFEYFSRCFGRSRSY